jgi:hypothetical protein
MRPLIRPEEEETEAVKSALKSSILAFAATAALMQFNLLPDAWSTAPLADESGFAARHAHENSAEVEAELGLNGA